MQLKQPYGMRGACSLCRWLSVYLHHVPGRLRLKRPCLVGRHAACEEACAAAMAIAGVIEASANPATGSLLIRYDRDGLSAQALWRALCERGLVWGASPLDEGSPVTRAKLAPPAVPGAAGWLVEAAGGAVLDKLLRHSTAALFGAFI